MFNLHDPDLEPGTTCFVCGQIATTIEHVIPKWLQRRFNLWNQHISLPNQTSIAYRQLTIPACDGCNSGALAALESRVERNCASDSDVWKWANKIHYGLEHKHRLLDWDRRHPGYKIGTVLNQHDPLERDRHFLHAVAGHFRVDPDPFGSVFRFEFSTAQQFAFAHIAFARSLCVCLGNVGYVVFVLDGQALKRDVATAALLADTPKDRVQDMFLFYAHCLEHFARHQLGQDIIMTDRFLGRVGRTVVHSVEPWNETRFRQFCRALGFLD